LAAVTGEHPGTVLEMIPGKSGTEHRVPPESFDLMTEMSVVANRVINWNTLIADSTRPEIAREMVLASAQAAKRGGRVVPLTFPEVVDSHFSFRTESMALMRSAVWREVVLLP